MFPSGTAVEPTDPTGLAIATTTALANAVHAWLPDDEEDLYRVSTQVDLDWVMLSLSCVPEAERSCTEAWLQIIGLNALPLDAIPHPQPGAAPADMTPTRDAIDWLEALLFEGHTYGRDRAPHCRLCTADDIQGYYQRTFRSAWVRWGFGGPLPPESLERLSASIEALAWASPPDLNRFSPAPLTQPRLAILPFEGPDRSLWAGQVNSTRWSDGAHNPSNLPRRWAVTHQATTVTPATLVEVLNTYLTDEETIPPHPVDEEPRDALGLQIASTLPALFPPTVLGAPDAITGPRTFVLSTPNPEEDHLIVREAIAQRALPDLDVWVPDGLPRAPESEAEPQLEPTSSPSTTMPGASM